MAEDAGPFQTAELMAKELQATIANLFGCIQNKMSASSGDKGRATKRAAVWGMDHATKHVQAASTYVQKLSQAADVHDRLHAHAEFLQIHIDMCHERTQKLTDAVAAASSLVGACVQVLHWNKQLRQIARNSPHYEKTGVEKTAEKAEKHHWKPVR